MNESVSSTIALWAGVGESGEGRARRVVALLSPRRYCWFALLVPLALVSAPRYAAGGSYDYDATALVMATGSEPDQVAVSYAGTMSRARLAAGVQALSREAGIAAGPAQVREEPVTRGSRELATSAEFTAPGLVRGRSGPLPVVAVARALPGWRRLRLAFLVAPDYRFHGPTSGEAEGFSFRLTGSAGAYQYDVERMDRAEAGRARGQAQPTAPASGGRSPWTGLRMALIGLSAVAASAAVWILVRSLRRGS